MNDINQEVEVQETISENTDETSLDSLVKLVENDSIVNWPDDKKNDFITLLKKRGSVSGYLLTSIAKRIYQEAISRKFIKENKKEFHCSKYFDSDKTWCRLNNTVGGRNLQDLEEIIKEKSDNILAELPTMKFAIQILKPNLVGSYDQIEKLTKEINKIIKENNKIKEDISDIENFDETKTMKEYKEYVKTQMELYNEGVLKANSKSLERITYKNKVDKALIKGFPEIAESIEEIVEKLLEQATTVNIFLRRIEEKVKFGDSALALDLLKNFEKDEKETSSELKDTLKSIKQKLKLYEKSDNNKKIESTEE